MWKQKMGMSIDFNEDIPITGVIDIIADSGFDAISPVWKAGDELAEAVKHARSRGLEIQSLHAPHARAADMWSADADRSRAAIAEFCGALEDCAALKIPVLVCHVWVGFGYTEKPNEIGLKSYDVLVRRACELGVKIAFENTEGEEFLLELMEHFKGNDSVGFCWDSGHEMCYNHSMDLLSLLGDRLIMTHINDNLGIRRFDGGIYWTDDLHLLPFDGVADWRYNVERLKRSRRMEILNFELKIPSKPNRHENDVYMQMKPEVYFAEAYKRACKIAYAYSQI